MRKIAVDEKLSNVRQYLEEHGYATTDLNQGLRGAAAIVVSGMDSNFLGDQTITTDVSIIDAAGLTPDEILHELEQKMHFKH